MLPEIIIAGLALVIVYLFLKLITQLLTFALGLALLVYLLGSPKSISGFIEEIGGYIQVAIEFGSSIVEKLL